MYVAVSIKTHAVSICLTEIQCFLLPLFSSALLYTYIIYHNLITLLYPYLYYDLTLPFS